MPDLVELIKASIDPDSIIGTLSLNGQVLSEADWRAPLTVQGDGTLEISTSTREQFLAERLQSSTDLVQHLILEFAQVRECFDNNEVQNGNRALGTALVDLKAFLNWYHSMLIMIPGGMEVEREQYLTTVKALAGTCEQLLQQQLFQSWWALGQTMQGRLEPQLNDLCTLCDKVSAAAALPH